ncbi:unnamed protein product [Somion occarium]|uniref:F-box domain-containing protein n=1 Tax=Somion occarium TaxID=3059160 RepID=A0ABP1E3M6_9APHY
MFMGRDPNRLSYLKELSVLFNGFSTYEASRALTKLLRQAHSLTTLVIANFDERFVIWDPHMMMGMRALGALKSPIETLSVRSCHFEYNDVRPDIMDLAGSLQQPLVHYAALKDFELPPAPYIFPHVHTVHLWHCPHVGIDQVFTSFPNLKNIICVNIDPPGVLREENLLRQVPSGVWPQLAEFGGILWSLYNLAPRCRFRRLKIYDIEPGQLLLLRTVVGDHRPTHLELVNTKRVFGMDRVVNLSPASITHLSICMELEAQPNAPLDSFEMTLIRTALVDCIRTIPVVFLVLRFDIVRLNKPRPSSLFGTAGDLVYFDMPAFVIEAGRRCPSLHYVFVSIGEGVSRWSWKLSRSELKQITLEDLPRDVAQQVMTDNELSFEFRL